MFLGKSLRKLDSITILLWIFIFFILLLFGYLTKIDNDIKNYTAYDNAIHKLKNINGKFDNFLLQKATFVDYDKINKSMSLYEEEIEFLDSKVTHERFSKEYKSLLYKIKELYELKKSSLEYYKSENALLLYSMHYLFDLNEDISKSKELKKNYRELTNKTLLILMRSYINDSIGFQKIEQNLTYLNASNQKNESLLMFINHVKINIKRIKKFNEIKNSQERLESIVALENLHNYLNLRYEISLLIEEISVSALFLLAVIILLILIVMNKRSIKLREELQGFKTAIENSYNSIVITDVESNITYVNERAQLDTGYSKEEMIGQNPRILQSGLHNKSFYDEMYSTLNVGKKWVGEIINKKKDGSMLYEKASIMPMYHDDEVVSYLAIKMNITDYIEEKNKVQHMAFHDSLTSLPNRMNIEEYLKNRLTAINRNDSKVAVLFIDLDKFKIINDTLGHDVGDELLIAVSKRIQSGLRESDILARVGGDEFILLIESSEDDYSATYVCEKILKLFNEPIQTASHLLNITLSIGISIYPDDDYDYKKLLKYADIAMYEAKNNGRNTYGYYRKNLSVQAHNRLDMEQNLKVALQNNEFHMMYQPQYNLENKTVVGLEALVRWNSHVLGNITPDKFIPVAEDTGYIVDIGLFIFEQSCKDFLIFQQSAKDLKHISINISTVQLYQNSFIDDILLITSKVGISHDVIMLEITETHIMKNIAQSVKLLDRLKSLGFSISIDDFGTGHSSLSYLKLFPIDELKIDKSFVDDLPHDTNDVAISKAIITLSKSMKYKNVAEGIENEAQEQFLLQNNCEIGQGYYFSKPKTKDDLIEFLKL